MNDHRETARLAAVKARQTAADKTMSTGATESVFRASVLDGIQRIRQLYDSDSAMARSTGVSQPTINKVLSGKQEPRLDAVGKIMDTVGASVTFPWEAKNTTQKIAVSGGANLPQFRTISLFEFEDGAVRETDETAAILPLDQLRNMSESLSLGAFRLRKGDRTHPSFKKDDLVIVDFTRNPPAVGNDSSRYLVGLQDGKLAIASSIGGALVIDIYLESVGFASLEQGKDYDSVDDAVIGKVVYHMAAL